MIAAMIKDGVVINTIIADESVFINLEAAFGVKIVNIDGIPCGVGWVTDDDGMTFRE